MVISVLDISSKKITAVSRCFTAACRAISKASVDFPVPGRAGPPHDHLAGVQPVGQVVQVGSAQEWLTPLAKNVNRIPVALASAT